MFFIGVQILVIVASSQLVTISELVVSKSLKDRVSESP